MLPYPIDYYGLDLDTYYYYVLTFMYIDIIFSMIIITAVDAMFMIHVQHACGMFAIVGHQLQCVGNHITEEYVKHSHPKLDPTFRHMTACIEKHRDMIAFSDLLEASYTWVFFVAVGVGILLISYGSFQTVLGIALSPKDAGRYVVFIIVSISIFFVLHFFSQRLLNHSQQIGEDLCQAEWYKTTLATQKLLNLVIMRSHVPCQLTAGKFMVMSMENFTWLVKTSVSYFTVMLSMR